MVEQIGDGPLEKYRRVLDEEVNQQAEVTSTNRGFRTNNHVVATCGHFKTKLSYFYPKKFSRVTENTNDLSDCKGN